MPLECPVFYLAPLPVTAHKESICCLALLCFRRKRGWYYKIETFENPLLAPQQNTLVFMA